jgi:hypothetical protein
VIAMMAPVVVVASLTVNVDAVSLPYFDPQGSERTSRNYAIHGAGSIPRELGERIVASDASQREIAHTLIALVNKEFTIVQAELRRLIDMKMGIEMEHVNTTQAIPEAKERWPEHRGPELPPWPPLGEGLRVVGGTAIKLGRVREYQLETRRYNRLASVQGHSIVRMRVSDARSVLGERITVVQVRRRDYSREWFRVWHLGIPLPFKEEYASTLVTNTEVALIDQLYERIPGVMIRYFVLSDDLREENDSKAVSLRTAMKEAAKQFEMHDKQGSK